MYYLGIDLGSTTVKLAVLDERYQLLYSTYERHHSDVRATLTQVIETAAAHFPGKTMTIAITVLVVCYWQTGFMLVLSRK